MGPRVRHCVRPGITGPWQLSPHRRSYISEHLEYDEAYVSKLTFRKDLGYLVKTVAAVATGRGR